MPSWYHVGTPRHFPSSTTSGSASCTRARSWLSVSPRQSASSLIRSSMSWEGVLSFCEPLGAMRRSSTFVFRKTSSSASRPSITRATHRGDYPDVLLDVQIKELELETSAEVADDFLGELPCSHAQRILHLVWLDRDRNPWSQAHSSLSRINPRTA